MQEILFIMTSLLKRHTLHYLLTTFVLNYLSAIDSHVF